MFTDSSKFILSDIKIYLTEIETLTNYENVTPQLHPLVNYLLDSAFLKMIGALESKVNHIKWFLGFNNLNARFDISKNLTAQSISISQLVDFYKMLLKISHELNIEYPLNSNLWKNFTLFDVSFNSIREIFENTDSPKKINLFRKIDIPNGANIINYTNSQYNEFINNNLLSKLVTFEEIYKKNNLSEEIINKKDTIKNNIIDEYNLLFTTSPLPKNSQNLNYDPIKSSLIEMIYKNTLNHRHMLAHNLNAAKYNLPDINTLLSSKIYFNNHYYRFLSVIYIDAIMQNFFKSYLKIVKRTKIYSSF